MQLLYGFIFFVKLVIFSLSPLHGMENSMALVSLEGHSPERLSSIESKVTRLEEVRIDEEQTPEEFMKKFRNVERITTLIIADFGRVDEIAFEQNNKKKKEKRRSEWEQFNQQIRTGYRDNGIQG